MTNSVVVVVGRSIWIYREKYIYIINNLILPLITLTLSSNVDLYVFNNQMVQGYRGVNVNTRDDDESLGDMRMKDHMDVSNQENVAPVYFQSLSLD